MHTSVTWAGESIVTSGATVMIAFFAMAISSFAFIQTMGLVIGYGHLGGALMVALTLVPAFLMLVGNRIFWPTTGGALEEVRHQASSRRRRRATTDTSTGPPPSP